MAMFYEKFNRKDPRSAFLSAVERCEMVSSKPPNEWSEQVLWPMHKQPIGIFGYNQTAMGSDYRVGIIEALEWTQLAPSKGQARTAIRAGAVRINGERCADEKRVLTASDALPNLSAIVIENGRRNFGVIEVCPPNTGHEPRH